MTFWCGSGSAVPCLWLMHPYLDLAPDADPDPAIFVFDLQDTYIKVILKKVFLLIIYWRYIYIIFPSSGTRSIPLTVDPDPGGPKTFGSIRIRIRIRNTVSKPCFKSGLDVGGIRIRFQEARNGDRMYKTTCGSYSALMADPLCGISIGIWEAHISESFPYNAIRIRIQEDKKYPKKIEKWTNISCFEVPDVLFWGLRASPVAWTSFMEA